MRVQFLASAIRKYHPISTRKHPRMLAMRRTALRILALIVTAGVLVIPVLIGMLPTDTSTGPDPVTITNYTADYVVAADGTLAAKEVITAEFPYGRHGIFRFWDLADPSDSEVRLIPENIKVTHDHTAP